MSAASEAMRSMCSAMAVPAGQGRPCCANQASAARGGRQGGRQGVRVPPYVGRKHAKLGIDINQGHPALALPLAHNQTVHPLSHHPQAPAHSPSAGGPM